jgi:hypothetical protein
MPYREMTSITFINTIIKEYYENAEKVYIQLLKKIIKELLDLILVMKKQFKIIILPSVLFNVMK